MKKEEIVITDHAKARGKELGLNEDKIKDLFMTSEKLKPRPMRELYKIEKYGLEKQSNVYYFRRKGSPHYPRLLFTVEHNVSKEGEDIWVVITVTKK